jgi:hypothetical protein
LLGFLFWRIVRLCLSPGWAHCALLW